MSFTLIELLVVISIIAILAAMLLPALSRAKDSANEASCISRLKQGGVAVVMYSDDVDGVLPFNDIIGNASVNALKGWSSNGLVCGSGSGFLTAWGNVWTAGYVNEKQILVCPGRREHGEIDKWKGENWSQINTDYVVGWWAGQWDAIPSFVGSPGCTQFDYCPGAPCENAIGKLMFPIRFSDYTDRLTRGAWIPTYVSYRGARILAADARCYNMWDQAHWMNVAYPGDVPHHGTAMLLLVDLSITRYPKAFGPTSFAQTFGEGSHIDPIRGDGNGDRNNLPYHQYGRDWWTWMEGEVRK